MDVSDSLIRKRRKSSFLNQYKDQYTVCKLRFCNTNISNNTQYCGLNLSMQRIEIDFTLYQQNEVRERKYEKLTTTDVLHSHYLESTINLRGFFSSAHQSNNSDDELP